MENKENMDSNLIYQQFKARTPINFSWDLGGKSVHIIFIQKVNKFGKQRIKEVSYKMEEKQKFVFGLELDLRDLISEYYPEYLPDITDPHQLSSILTNFKSLRYMFKVDGKRKINSGQSQVEMKIEDSKLLLNELNVV